MTDYPFRIIGLDPSDDIADVSETCRKLQEMGYYCRTAKIKIYEETKTVVCYCYRDFKVSEMEDFFKYFDLQLEES